MSMNFLCIVLLLLVALCALQDIRATDAGSRGSVSGTSTDNHVRQISELAAKSKGNIITLDDSTFGFYAHAKPRPYSLVVFLTAAHPKFKCSICKDIDQELALVAQAYTKSCKDKKDDPNVFFVRMDYESAQKTFNSYGVASVPVVFHIPPMSPNDNSGKNFAISPREKYQVPPSVDAESLAGFLRDRTGVSVEIKRSMIGSYIALIIAFGILALLVRPVINSLDFWLNIIRQKSIWALVSAGVYTCAISGMIFDIIRSPPMYHANPQTGQILFFYPQSGHQFVAEGFIIGFLNLGCALALIFVAAYAPKIKDNSTRNMVMIGGIVAFVFCFRMVRSLYIMKNGWYGRAF